MFALFLVQGLYLNSFRQLRERPNNLFLCQLSLSHLQPKTMHVPKWHILGSPILPPLMMVEAVMREMQLRAPPATTRSWETGVEQISPPSPEGADLAGTLSLHF